MNNSQLSNHFWRYKSGYMAKETFVQALELELDGLVAFAGSYQGPRSLLRDFDPDSLRRFEDCLTGISRSMKQQQFDTVIQQLRGAKRQQSLLKKLIDVRTLFQTVQGWLHKLHDDLKNEQLLSLPVIGNLTKMSTEVEESLSLGEYRKAEFLLLGISEGISEFSREGGQQAKSKKQMLTQRLVELKKQIHTAQRWASYLPAGEHALPSDVISPLYPFLEEGNLQIVETLLGDLELYQEPANSFVRTYKEIAQIQSQNDDYDEWHEALINKLKAEGWAGATIYILSSQLRQENREF